MEIENVQAQVEQVDKQSRVWSMLQINIASFIGGPFCGCYLVSKNYKTLENPKLSKKLILIGISSFLLLITFFMFLPQSLIDKIPKTTVPAVYTTLIYYYAKTYQKQPIVELMKKGTKRQSYFKLILCILVFLLIQLPVILAFGYLATLIHPGSI